MMSIDMRSADEWHHAQYNTATNTLRNDLDVLQQSAQLLSRWISCSDFQPSVHNLKKQRIILLATGHPVDEYEDEDKVNFKI